MAAFPVRWVVIITVAAVGIGLAACGASPSSRVAGLPTVASLSNVTGKTQGSRSTGRRASSSTKVAAGDPTRLVDEWAACERSHGDVNQADPIIDAHGVINITTPPPGSGSLPAGDPHGVTGTCSQYLAAAQRVLRAADPVQDPLGMTNQADLLKYVACMRASGVPNYPYPSGPNDRETNFNGTGVDPTSPSVVKISVKCGSRLHLPLWWSAGWGPPGDITVQMSLPPGAPRPGPLVPATRGSNRGAPAGPAVSGAGSGAGAGG